MARSRLRPAPGAAQPEPTPGFAAVGQVLTTRGVHGEIKVLPLTEFPERFNRGRTLWLGGQPRRVVRSQWVGEVVYLRLGGIATIEEAAPFRGTLLEIREELLAALPAGEYYLHDLVGLAVVTDDGRPLGRLAEVLATGANDVYVVRGEAEEWLVPALEDVVLAVDLESRTMRVSIPHGLEPRPLARAEPKPRPRPRGPSAGGGPPSPPA